MEKGELLHIRPRFQLITSGQVEETISRLRDAIDSSPEHIKGRITGGHVTLDIVGPEQHFWSPHVDLRVEPADTHHQSQISGLIGPRPTVWTLFMFFYFAVLMIGFIISSYGISKWMMNEYSHLIWGFPIALILMGSAFWTSKMGEKLGADQTEELKNVIRKSIKE